MNSKNKKINFLTFNYQTLSHSLTPKSIIVLYISQNSKVFFLVYHVSRYLIDQPRYDRFSKTGPKHVFSSPL